MQSELHIETEKKSVSAKKLNWEFIGKKEKIQLSTKPGGCAVVRSSLHLFVGGGGN